MVTTFMKDMFFFFERFIDSSLKKKTLNCDMHYGFLFLFDWFCTLEQFQNQR